MEDAVPWVVEALQQLPTSVEVTATADRHSDLTIRLWDTVLDLDLVRYSLVAEDLARRITTDATRGRTGEAGPDTVRRVTFVVADRITGSARATLLDAGVGYLDLRGHLGLHARGIIVDSSVDLGQSRPARIDALGGRVGLEVATALLMDPDRGPAVRELARDLERSPSTVSEVLSRLRNAGRLTADRRVVDEKLFWDVVDRWPDDRTRLSTLPPSGEHTRVSVPLRLGLSDVERSTGWALTDTAAAAALKAPIAIRADQPLDFYVPSLSIVRRAQTLLGDAASPLAAACTVRAAPVPAVCNRRVDAPGNYFEWPTAHPLFVALDLAQDVGRGREILSQWDPGDGWSRVW